MALTTSDVLLRTGMMAAVRRGETRYRLVVRSSWPALGRKPNLRPRPDPVPTNGHVGQFSIDMLLS
jgi:hypothetical protein